jgi:UDP-N-acetylmuramoyl-L-alanyl-D-glutamate--2,6-diaminopimelate ligase
METTINTKLGDMIIPHKTKDKWVTTPPASVLQKFLKTAVEAKCKYAILEVTSQAIDQNRIYGIPFDILIYTNLSHDHLDYHKTRDNYLGAKLKLFRDNPQAAFVINADDTEWQKFNTPPSRDKLLYSIKKPVDHGAVARKILPASDSSTFTIAHDSGQTTINLLMPGDFNIRNALAVFCAGVAIGIDPDIIKRGLENVTGVTGRMESIKVAPNQPFTVIVDYAHNPDSLKNVYETITSSLRDGGHMIAVLGATGHRDKTKRPIMGTLAGIYADMVVFTNEDPYDEDPVAIMEEVAEGILKGGAKHQWRLNRNYWKVIDREQAIKKALREAQKGDVVIITGKGAEEVMAVGLEKFVPFSDRKIARSELERMFGREKS